MACEDASPCTGRQFTEVNALNAKSMFDDMESDKSINRKSLFRHQDAWETLRLRNAQFAASFDHMILSNMAISSQTGNTETQVPVSPIKQGAGDSQNQQPAGAVYPPIRNADQMGSVAAGGVMTAQEQVAASISELATSLNDTLAKLVDATNALLAAAAGVAAANAAAPAKTS